MPLSYKKHDKTSNVISKVFYAFMIYLLKKFSPTTRQLVTKRHIPNSLGPQKHNDKLEVVTNHTLT